MIQTVAGRHRSITPGDEAAIPVCVGRRHLAIPALVLILVLAACATSPVYLSALEDRSYPDLNSMFEDLDCASRITIFHVGRGVVSAAEAIDHSRHDVERNLSVMVEIAEQRGEHIWVLATEDSQVVGALDSRGGRALRPKWCLGRYSTKADSPSYSPGVGRERDLILRYPAQSNIAIEKPAMTSVG